MTLEAKIIGEVQTFNNQEEPYRIFIKISSNNKDFYERLRIISKKYAIFIKQRFLSSSRYKVRIVDYHSTLLQIEKPLLEFTHLFRIEMEKDNSISDVIVRSFKSKEDANNIMNQIVFTLEKFVENQKHNYMKLTDENREVRNRSQF